jgi:hypothetical protein
MWNILVYNVEDKYTLPDAINRPWKTDSRMCIWAFASRIKNWILKNEYYKTFLHFGKPEYQMKVVCKDINWQATFKTTWLGFCGREARFLDSSTSV